MLAGAVLGLLLTAAGGVVDIVVPLTLLGAFAGWLAAAATGGNRPPRVRGGPIPPMPVPPAHARQEADALLADALDRGIIDRGTHERLQALLDLRRGPAAAAARPRPEPATPPMPVPSAASLTEAAPTPNPSPTPSPSASHRPEAQRLPGQRVRPVERRVRAVRDLVMSDLAVHGLTYLGVLLLFAGAMGFVLFSFGSVQRSLRPAAELAVPGVLLWSARFLRRRGAPFVATALGLLGGVLLPPFLFASFVDGVAVPPDLSGEALIVALVGVSLATAGAYAWYSRRDPRASVRYLVAPAIWLAFWAAGLATAPLVEGGYSLRHWSSTQLALVSIAIALTALVIRLRPGMRLAAPTERVIPAGIVLTSVLTAALAGGEGWPSVPIVAAGVAALVVTESIVMPRQGVQMLQPAIVGLTILGLAPDLGAGRVGVVGTFCFLILLEWLDLRRPGPVGLGAAGIGVGASLLACLLEPWTIVIAFGGASVWAHVRRLWPLRGVADDDVAVAAAAAGLPAVTAVGFGLVTSPGIAMVISAGGVVAAAAAARLWRPGDRFLGWWAAAAAIVIVIATASPEVGPAAAAVAASLCAIALLLAPMPGWATGSIWPAAMAWSIWTWGIAVGFTVDGRTLVLACFGAILVIASGARALRHPAAYAGGTGLAVVGLALTMPASGWSRTGVLVAWMLASGAAAAWGEARGTGPIGLLLEALAGADPLVRAALRVAPLVAAAAALALVFAQVAEQTGITGGRRSWSGVAVAVAGLADALAARLVAGRRPVVGSGPSGQDSLVADALAVAGFVTIGVGIAVALPAPWPTTVALVAPIALPAVLGPRLRGPATSWVAWASSAALAVLLAERVGVAERDLWIASFGWGVLALIGGLWIDDVRMGRRASGQTVRTLGLVPPMVLGALVVPASVAFAFGGSPSWYGTWSAIASLVYLILAVQLRAGAVVGVSAAFASVAVASLWPVSPLDEPVLLAPWAAVLIAVALLGARRNRGRDEWARWDHALLVVAHGVAAVALTLALALDVIVPTWASFAGLATVLAVATRRWEWWLGGNLLMLVAAGAAGPGWLALAFAASSVAAAATASRSAAPLRWGLQAAAALLAAGAWERLVVWTDWPAQRAVVVTAAVAAGLVWGAAVLLRRGWLAVDWTIAVGGLGSVGVVVAGAAVRMPELGADPRVADLVSAIGAASIATGLGLTAIRLSLPWQREASALAGTVAGAEGVAALALSREAEAAIAVAAGLALVALWMGIWRTRPRSPWLRSAGLASVAADGAALVLAASVLPRRDLLEAALVLTGVECAVGGLLLRRPHLVTPAPVFVVLAWFVHAADAFRGEVQWFTVPAGVAILAAVSIERRARRVADRSPISFEIVASDYLGMSLLVVASVVEIVTTGPIRGLVAIAAGALVMAWGALTRVRRRAWFGGGSAGVAVGLMLGGPIARLVPQIRGPALWGLLVLIGLGLLAAAILLERGRAKVGAMIRRLDQLMDGWE